MPKGVYERKVKDEEMVEEAKTEPAKMFPVVLKKNYVPVGAFEIIGYMKPKVERRDSAGKMLVVEPEQFVAGEMSPAPYPGVGYDGKIWAGTHISLPIDEAKALFAKRIADRADVIAA